MPQLTFQAESGGDYVIYVSGYNFVIMYTDGEEGHFFDISDIYDAGFNLQTSLKRETYWEFDPVVSRATDEVVPSFFMMILSMLFSM